MGSGLDLAAIVELAIHAAEPRIHVVAALVNGGPALQPLDASTATGAADHRPVSFEQADLDARLMEGLLGRPQPVLIGGEAHDLVHGPSDILFAELHVLQ